MQNSKRVREVKGFLARTTEETKRNKKKRETRVLWVRGASTRWISWSFTFCSRHRRIPGGRKRRSWFPFTRKFGQPEVEECHGRRRKDGASRGAGVYCSFHISSSASKILTSISFISLSIPFFRKTALLFNYLSFDIPSFYFISFYFILIFRKIMI